MPATSAASLALATRLRDLSDDAVARVIRERRIPPARLSDVFDLAEALLDSGSIALALADLPRPALAALSVAASATGSVTLATIAETLNRSPERIAHDLAPATDALLTDLVDTTVDVWPAVRAELASWPARGMPSLAALTQSAAPPLSPAMDDAAQRRLDRAAAERAFTTTMAVTEVALAVQSAPARLLARGGLALPDNRRLASAADVPLEAVTSLVAMAAEARLIVAASGVLQPSGAIETWRIGSIAERWSRLADAWADALPRALREALGECATAGDQQNIVGTMDDFYPVADQERRRGLRALRERGELLGLWHDDRFSTFGRAALAGGTAAASDALAPLVPPEVRQVYVQHDLTVVSPGPLAGELDARLRRAAEVESTSQASRYRFTRDSVTRAIASGETSESLTEFLTTISLTGVPQPLQYLIDDASRRYGLVRVATATSSDDAPHARTVVRSDDAVLLDAILVDAGLGGLGLRRLDATRLVSRLPNDVVLWALIDGRYPAAVEQGTPLPERPGGEAPARPAGDDARAIAAAVARIRAGSIVGDNGDDAWVARQWQLAMRGKLAVRATVRLPDGSERQFELEPTGMGAGRVRGRDRSADIERTLPVASIAALEPLA